MNNFSQSTRQLFSLVLVVLLHNSLHAVTFRNQPLTDFIEHGQALCADFPENNFLILELENDNFDIRNADINELYGLKEAFEEISSQRGACISSKICNITSNTINYNSSYLVGRESMNITAKTALHLRECCLESPLISITGSKMDFIDSFLINPEVMNIVIDYPGSEYVAIQLIFHEKAENPTVISGEIDLTDNSPSTDETRKQLIISNVKEVRVQFVWGQNLSGNLEADLEDAEVISELTPITFTDEEYVDADEVTSSEFLGEILEETVANPVEEVSQKAADEDIAVVNSDEEAVVVLESDEQAVVVSSDEETVVMVDASEEEVVVSQKEEAQTTVKAYSRSHSVEPGLVARYYQKLIAFSDKYIRSYFSRK